MLEYSRPAWSQSEEAFIADYIEPLPNAYFDDFGNIIVKVGKAPKVCWTSHTDTVAYGEGAQALALSPDNILGLDPLSEAECLGADCGAGVWLMRRMILAGKPGLYLFHRDEESGGNGSSWIAKNTPELLAGIKFCISLDRKGKNSIITEQYLGATASNEFAASIAPMLPKGMKADPTGSFTDSAFYAHLVPECSNLSVGYESCHSPRETLDLTFIDKLLACLLKLDYSKLRASRTPIPPRSERYTSHYIDSDYNWEPFKGSTGGSHIDNELLNLVQRHPRAVALLLQQWDLNADDIYNAMTEL